MPKSNPPPCESPESERRALPISGDFLSMSFGEALFFHRDRLELSQKVVATASGLSESYFSELENSKRMAPPRATAIRIARALKLSGPDEIKLVCIAVSERAAMSHDLHLPPKILQLMAMLRIAGPRLSDDALQAMKVKLQEVAV